MDDQYPPGRDLQERDLLVELRVRVERLEKALGNGDPHFLSRTEFAALFQPIKLVVYGLVGLLLTSVVGAVISLAVHRGGTP